MPRKKPKLAKKHQPKGVQKSRNLTLQKNIRLRAVRSPKTSAVNPIPAKSPQGSSAASKSLTGPGPPRGRKRGYVFEDGRPSRRLRKDSESVPESSQPLTEANLQEHNRLTESGISDEMVSAASRSGARKRTLSRYTVTADVTQETLSRRSERSSYTAAYYRWTILHSANVIIQSGPLPEEIKSRIDDIIQHKISKTRKRELSQITEKLCKDFVRILQMRQTENSCVSPIERALSSMDGSEKFIISKDLDWNPSLKPSIERQFWEPTRRKSNSEAAGPITRPKKGQQSDTYAIPPSPPPPLPPPLSRQSISPIKTPRPDITIGLGYSTMDEALKARGLSEQTCQEFLQYLQEEEILCSDRGRQDLVFQFPPIVVECKSYATGKPVFDAQNQASTAGACTINLQHKLAELAESTSLGAYRCKRPLAFSICTEGPHMELWVHYTTTSEEGVRKYRMNILKTCHASLPERVVKFLVVVDKVMSWAGVEFVNDIAEQLDLVQRAL